MIVDMDKIGFEDTVYTCETVQGFILYPSSKITQQSMWVISKMENGQWRGCDTIYGDTISYFEPFTGGYISNSGTDGLFYYSVEVEVRPLVLNAWYVSGNCSTPVHLHANTNYSGSGAVSYSWEPGEYLDDPDIADPNVVAFGNNIFSVTLNTPTGCSMTRELDVLIEKPETPSICMVSVDSASNKNIVYWESSFSGGTDSVFIYRETDITNNYKVIGQFATDDPGFFIDTASYPLIQSNKYVISVSDSCGYSSEFSGPHKTIHLTINQGQNNSWNLIWEPYVGFEVSTYRILRADADGDFALIGTTSGSSTQYTDFTAPSGIVRYQVEVINPSACNISGLKSTQDVMNKSRSNIASNHYTALEFNRPNGLYRVFPNPFDALLYIEATGTSGNSQVELTGMDGKIIMRDELKAGKLTLDGSDLSKGNYILKIIAGNETNVIMIVKQ